MVEDDLAWLAGLPLSGEELHAALVLACLEPAWIGLFERCRRFVNVEMNGLSHYGGFGKCMLPMHTQCT